MHRMEEGEPVPCKDRVFAERERERENYIVDKDILAFTETMKVSSIVGWVVRP
jgi:hypothetical protein